MVFQDEDEIVRIRVTRKTREKLKEYGIKGESYEVILRRLMEQEEKKKGKVV